MRDKKYVEHKQKGEISKLGARGQSGKAVQTALHVNPNLGGGNFTHTDTHPACWLSLNNSETVKAVTLAFCSI